MGVRYCDQPGAGRKKNICGAKDSPAKMLPSERPTVRSMSRGVRTSRCSTRSPKPGKNRSSVRWTVSPRFSFSESQSLSRSLYGVYWMKQDRTCLPGGAMSASMVDWIAQSMYGFCEYQPYFALSNARRSERTDELGWG